MSTLLFNSHRMLLKTTTVLFATCLVFSQVSAQWMNVPTKISTPRGTVKINIPTYQPRYYNYNWQNNPSQKVVSKRYEFTIIFLNDSTVTTKTRINIGDSIHTLKWTKKGNQFVVTPTQTKEIYRVNEIGEKIVGKPMDSCWVFLVDSGRISTYSVTSDIYDPAIAFIRRGNDRAIVPLTDQNLLEMVKNNNEATKLVEQKKLLKAIEIYNQE